ncbi:MAG: hypothetical protein Alpg2KO_05400 [Alphaproteobacteria bacterium]
MLTELMQLGGVFAQETGDASAAGQILGLIKTALTMETWSDTIQREVFLKLIRQEAMDHIFTFAVACQLLFIAGAFVLARIVSPTVARICDNTFEDTRLDRFTDALVPLSLPIAWLGFQALALLVSSGLGLAHKLNEIVLSLLAAWIGIRLAARLVKNKSLRKVISLSAWVIAALIITEQWDATIEVLDGAAFTLGEVRLSLLMIIKGGFSVIALLWAASFTAGFVERRLHSVEDLTPSVQVLLSKLTRIILMIVAIVMGLSAVGIDLTAFAVFSGAVGVGIGFGLQKVVSNLVSGVILLLDRSIKPGDVISVDATYGAVTKMGARYTSVITRDRKEYLIPNEDLITQQVCNWSYSDKFVRQRIDIGVAYGADVPKAIKLCIEAANETPRIVADPAPACLLMDFADSAVILQLRVWITDPSNGLSNVKSAVRLKIWEKFHEHDIEIPFPQQDLHLRSVSQEVRDQLAIGQNGHMSKAEA